MLFTYTAVLFVANTSVSSSCMTSRTSCRLSMNELTATRSILLVVALYSVRRMFPPTSPLVALLVIGLMEKVRFTNGDNSLSTCNALRATEASLGVGNGTSRVLEFRLAQDDAWSPIRAQRTARMEIVCLLRPSWWLAIL